MSDALLSVVFYYVLFIFACSETIEFYACLRSMSYSIVLNMGSVYIYTAKTKYQYAEQEQSVYTTEITSRWKVSGECFTGELNTVERGVIYVGQ